MSFGLFPPMNCLAGSMSCKLVGQFLAVTPALLNFKKVSCLGGLLAQRPFVRLRDRTQLPRTEMSQPRAGHRPAAISEKCRSSGVPDLGSDNLAQQPAVNIDSIQPSIAAKHV